LWFTKHVRGKKDKLDALPAKQAGNSKSLFIDNFMALKLM